MSGSLLQLSLTFELFPLFIFLFVRFNCSLLLFFGALSLGSMETRLAFFVLVFILQFQRSRHVREPVRSPIVYSRDQLLALSSAAA